MSYFDGFEFFVAWLFIIGIAIVLRLLEKRIAVWILISSLFFVVTIFFQHPQQLATLTGFFVLQWLNVMGYLKARKKYKREKKYYYVAMAIAIAPVLYNKMATPLAIHSLGFIGLSYISFRVIQLIIEIYDGLIKEVRLLDFVNFMLFFPTMSSGPIDRFRRFATDHRAVLPRVEYAELLGTGILRVVMGVLYKFVIAAFLFGYVQRAGSSFTMLRIGAYFYLYGFYLFFDFAGYSLMAVGTANLMGIQTPMNFDRPFLSINIKDFWNRWHITLSHWFRDYVFSRIAKNLLKKKWFSGTLPVAIVAYIVNMSIMGAWHGFTYSYLLYGLYHGALLAGNEWYEQKSALYQRLKDKKGYRLLSWAVTFHLVMFGFFIFSGHFASIMRYWIFGY